MNAIQMRLEMDRLNDRVKSPRYHDDDYYSAINQAIGLTLNDRIDNIKTKKDYSAQSVQRIRDELYTLIVPEASIIPASDIVPFPADYYHYLSLDCIIDGTRQHAFATDYNRIAVWKESSLRRPSDQKAYYNETNAGLRIYHGTGVFSQAFLDYIKKPSRVSIGNEGNKITTGAVVLLPGTTYYVYDLAVHNGVTYYEGETFIASVTALTSGTVISSGNIVNCDLPDMIIDEVVRRATGILTGTTENFVKKQQLEKDNDFS